MDMSMGEMAPMPDSGIAPGAEKPPPPDYRPNNTIYINNISEKIKIQTLLTELSAIFNQFGSILEIHAKKNLRMRGQAFIVFENVESAQKAVSSMQGFPFHDKKMRIAYAKGDSDIIAKKNGTFVEKDKSKKDKKRKKKKEKKAMSNPMQAMMNMMNPQMMMQMQKMMQSGGMQMPMNMASMAKMMPQMQANMQKMMTQMQTNPAAAPKSAEIPSNMGLPEGKFGSNNIIFVQDLPEEVDEKMLQALFNQFNGYSEVRMAPSKTGRAAFIEYTSEATAAHAKDTLQGFKVTPTTQLKITFAKR